jgi:SAM-dependent methyltransferase
MEPLESHLLGQTAQRSSFWHEVRATAVLERVPVGRRSALADIGAGAGLLGDILRRDRPECLYHYYEPLDALAARLAERFEPGARLRNETDVSEVDVVTLLDVLEHIEDDRGFLGELVGAMRPDATLVLTVPAVPALWSPWDEQLGHFRRYTRRTLRAVANSLPVEVVEVSYLFPELLVPGFARRILRRRRGIKDGGGSGAEFPVLPRPLDRSLRVLSGLTYRARKVSPAGTSLVLVARRTRS